MDRILMYIDTESRDGVMLRDDRYKVISKMLAG